MLTVARGLLLAGAAFLLLSIGGGAIFGAPLTMPLLYLAARTSRSPSYRMAAGVVAALTAAEAGWAVTYTVGGEANASIWAAPLTAALGVMTLFALTARPREAHRLQPGTSARPVIGPRRAR